MNYNWQDATSSTCNTSSEYYMTLGVEVPCAIKNIKSRDSANSNENHNSSCNIGLFLDDDSDYSNGHLGGFEGRLLEVGKYVHLKFPGCSSSGGVYYFFDELPIQITNLGRISNYLEYISNSGKFFDFTYNLSSVSSGWNVIIDYGN